MTISRADIEGVLWHAEVDGNTVDERNAQRRAAVEVFLEHVPDHPGPQGRSMKEMILSDLQSYKYWERNELPS